MEDDLFGEVLDAEALFTQQGRERGLADGTAQGAREGRALGLAKGAELGVEIGYYSGCALRWAHLGDSRAQAAALSVRELAQELLATPSDDEALQQRLDRLRALFKKLCVRLKKKQPFTAAEENSF
eukprot:m.124547 g.124547  ORF g.124547 m.124547 type:complete len:126 (-) comp9674_c2_seq1:5772-6149(-)